MDLVIKTPRWAVPLLSDEYRYLGAKGGRASGKSHFFAEKLVEEHVYDPNLQTVCVREVQKSLKYSSKKLLEEKIRALGVSSHFRITRDEIRRKGGDGLIIFTGLQDHTADSIKSLEGFDRCLAEEAQSLSNYSLEILVPTIRKPGSRLYFSWNPENETDAVEQLLIGNPEALVVHVDYDQNPWCPESQLKLAEWWKKKDYEKYLHIWKGKHNTRSKAQIFAGLWRVDEFTPGTDWDGPYQGLDFGFSSDPFAFTRSWIYKHKLYIEYDYGGIGVELDKINEHLSRVPRHEKYVTRADSSRPESISYLRRHGMPHIQGVEKWPGSVEDGVEFLKTFDEIVIHVRCKDMMEEAKNYCYKIDKRSGDVLPDIVDSHNHRWDSVRYALAPLIKRKDLIFRSL